MRVHPSQMHSDYETTPKMLMEDQEGGLDTLQGEEKRPEAEAAPTKRSSALFGSQSASLDRTTMGAPVHAGQTVRVGRGVGRRVHVCMCLHFLYISAYLFVAHEVYALRRWGDSPYVRMKGLLAPKNLEKSRFVKSDRTRCRLTMNLCHPRYDQNTSRVGGRWILPSP